jgi:hypothetical protein
MRDVMPMKIEGQENLRDIFSIFHDGGISSCRREGESLLMEVEIQYLAERINPDFRKFMVRLNDVKNLSFSTWPSDLKSPPVLLDEAEEIFKAELEILEGDIENEKIKVVCNQHSSEFDYCGGELYLSASSAEVTDEANKSYSIEGLDILCKGYWDDWANKNKA